MLAKENGVQAKKINFLDLQSFLRFKDSEKPKEPPKNKLEDVRTDDDIAAALADALLEVTVVGT